jgi:hypothetical protein
MKRAFAALTLLTVLFLPTACQNGFPFGHTATAPTPPLNPPFASVTVVTAAFPAAVTIRPGGSVEFVNIWLDITLKMDDGAGNCTPDTYLTVGTPVTFTFPSAGVYNYIEPNFGGLCSDFLCMPPCSGMAGIIWVE